MVVTSAFSVHEPEFDGFFCNDISICGGNGTDRSASLASPPDHTSHFPTPFIVMARKPHFWRYVSSILAHFFLLENLNSGAALKRGRK